MKKYIMYAVKFGRRAAGCNRFKIGSEEMAEEVKKEKKLSDAKRKANDKWIKENYKQVKLSMPNEEAEALEKYCEEKELTKAGFIRSAIKEKMEREP